MRAAGYDGRALVWNIDAAAVPPQQPADQDPAIDGAGAAGRGKGGARGGTRQISDAQLEYTAPAPIESLAWSAVDADWLAIGCGDQVQALHV